MFKQLRICMSATSSLLQSYKTLCFKNSVKTQQRQDQKAINIKIKPLALAAKFTAIIGMQFSLVNQPVQANPYTDPVWEQWNQIKAKNDAWWRSLSPRQKSIVHATNQILSNYQQRTGQAPYPNQGNTLQIMRMVGATDGEYNLVANAIHNNYLYFQANQRAGKALDDTQSYVNCLMTGRLDCY